MTSFFHGWRRKAGCVLLVIAVLLMAAWGWSGHIHVAISFPLYAQQHRIAYRNGDILWSSQSPSDSYGMEWSVEQFNKTRHGRRHFDDAWEFPPWAPVLSLTVLSAYLILWKPRTRERLANSAQS
ncbi:MAG: hypothetical protein JSS49_24200 [Planctomycetes bacterium]|nr:hypothetical protein [Planctomycetota bacterium]